MMVAGSPRNRFVHAFARTATAWLMAGALCLLAACSWQSREDGPSIDERVRAPSAAGADASAAEPALRNPALTELERESDRARSEGDLARAETLLERALRMDSRDSRLLGRMAEVQLARGHWARAESFAERARAAAGDSADQCRRSWRMVALAREGAGDMKGAVRAWNKAEACPKAPGTASGGGRGL